MYVIDAFADIYACLHEPLRRLCKAVSRERCGSLSRPSPWRTTPAGYRSRFVPAVLDPRRGSVYGGSSWIAARRSRAFGVLGTPAAIKTEQGSFIDLEVQAHAGPP